jgi:multiple sugar transport system substrate-binding protein
LHYNKRLFREAGLDPERPPKTIEQLDEWAERLTRWEVALPGGSTEMRAGYLPEVPDKHKRLIQVGFLPSEPGWWSYAWGYYFGGRLLDGTRISAADGANQRAYDWVASYSRKIGVAAAQRFRSGFGNFSSPQNPFLSGRVAMQLQGVWMYNFINKFSPGMQWSAAPFPYPADRPELANTTQAEADILVIPKGSRRAAEAFEFMRYVNSQEGMELLCMGQRKFSPLRQVSERFWNEHPHPLIHMFRELALSENAFSTPQVSVWNEYQREMVAAYDSIQHLSLSPALALESAEARIQASLNRELRILERRASHDTN